MNITPVTQQKHVVENQWNENFKLYEKSIQDIKKRHDQFKLATSVGNVTGDKVNISPSVKFGIAHKTDATPFAMMNSGFKGGTPSMFGSDGLLAHGLMPKMTLGAAIIMPPNDNTKLSFQIRKPVKMDKFGLVRLATPENAKSASSSPERNSRSDSRSRSPSRSSYNSRPRRGRRRSRSLSRSRTRTHSRSRSRSRSRDRRNKYFSKHEDKLMRSRSRSRSNLDRRVMVRRDSFSMRSLTRSPSQVHSRMPMMKRGYRRRRGGGYNHRSPTSPFLSRRYMSGNVPQQQRNRNKCSRSPYPNRSHMRRRSRGRRYSRSPTTSPYHHSFMKESGDHRSYGNRTWQRQPLSVATTTSDTIHATTSISSSNPVSQVERKSANSCDPQETKIEEMEVTEDPSIEEIDEIINKAQRERKQEIIKRDKEILKKTSEGTF